MTALNQPLNKPLMMKSIALLLLGVAVMSLGACACRRPVVAETVTTLPQQVYVK